MIDQEAVDRLRQQAETRARDNGHALARWRVERRGVIDFAVSRCEGCGAEAAISLGSTAHHLSGLALDLLCFHPPLEPSVAGSNYFFGTPHPLTLTGPFAHTPPEQTR